MAQKFYTKGMAKRCADMARYITRYELNQPGNPDPAWTTTLQNDAGTILTAANAIKAAIAYREQA